MALDFDLKVASVEIVVEVERMPAEMIESLPAEFVSVETATEQTEKVIVGVAEAFAAEQEQTAAGDLPWQKGYVIVS